MQYYQRTQTKDTQIGLGNTNDLLEKHMEMLEEIKESLKGDKEDVIPQ